MSYQENQHFIQRRVTTKGWLFLFLLLQGFAANPTFANIQVLPIEESSLTFDLSPNNFKQSPSNFKNSISNFKNSPSNFKNSPSNFENSSSNFKNSINGKRSIVIERDGEFLHVGYYVMNSDGLLNVFSTSGTRLFFCPPESSGVYHGDEGFFCGVLVEVNGTLRLALTKVGRRVLYAGE